MNSKQHRGFGPLGSRVWEDARRRNLPENCPKCQGRRVIKDPATNDPPKPCPKCSVQTEAPSPVPTNREIACDFLADWTGTGCDDTSGLACEALEKLLNEATMRGVAVNLPTPPDVHARTTVGAAFVQQPPSPDVLRALTDDILAGMRILNDEDHLPERGGVLIPDAQLVDRSRNIAMALWGNFDISLPEATEPLGAIEAKGG